MGISVKDLVLNFIAGGVVVAGTVFLATRVSSKWAALFWSLPLTLAPVIIYLHLRKAKQEDISTFAGNIVPGLLVLIGYVIILYLALKKFSFWEAFGISLIGFIILAIIFMLVVKTSKKIEIVEPN